MEFADFRRMHASQLSKVPALYWEALHQKLQYEVYDAGEYFTMTPHGNDWNVVVSHKDGICTTDPKCIFLVDHSWTYQPHKAKEQLLSIPGLAGRMAGLMDIFGVPTLPEGSEEGSYDADSESGDEVRDWSQDESGGDQSGVEESSDMPLKSAVAAGDGYNSGDLGDESHAYFTEMHHSQSDSDDGQVPQRSFMERYSLSGEIPVEQATVPDKPVSPPCQLVDPSRVTQTHAISPSPPCSDGGEELTNQIVEPADEAPPSEGLVARILDKMWHYNLAYTVSNTPIPVWYVMDEFGSRIRHSDDPTIAMTTLFYIPAQMAFSFLWPLRDLKYGEEITRNCLPGGMRLGLERACHAIPWTHGSHMTLDNPLWSQLDEFRVPEVEERCNEQLPSPSLPAPPPKPQYTVYTDIELVKSFLTHPAFNISPSRKKADILWLCDHFKRFRSLRPDQFVNQFPCENVLTCKDLLVTVARRVNQAGASPLELDLTIGPRWLPQTFNLLYELPHMVRCYLEREKRGADNTWILKPWNLGRGLDIHITNNLVQIIRLGQAGPKVASKYIINPVLFDRPEIGLVKFDIRYVVLLLSSHPPVLYAYNVFWLRFANKPFSLGDFYDYEKHFTVMNYQEEAKLKQIHYNEFIPLFEGQYPQYQWSTIQGKIFTAFKELFTSACSAEPPAGIGHSVQSRAIYAVDLMLEWEECCDGCESIQPKILEVNFSPDCVRACRYHPDFFNHVFEGLFLDSSSWREDLPVTRIL